MLFMSGSGEGWVCSKSSERSPGSGRESGAGSGFGTSPIFAAACKLSMFSRGRVRGEVSVVHVAPG